MVDAGTRVYSKFKDFGIGGCDIVLGVDWMRRVSPLAFDFDKLEVTVEIGGRKLT